MRVVVEAAVPDQDSVWAAAFPEVAAEVARVRADQAEGAAARAAPEVELMPEICGARRGREAVAAVAQAREPVEVLAVAQAARVDPEGVVAAQAASEAVEAALEEEAPERALQAQALAVQVASEVAAGLAQWEALPDPAETQANG
jgi:hypothetical protein